MQPLWARKQEEGENRDTLPVEGRTVLKQLWPRRCTPLPGAGPLPLTGPGQSSSCLLLG